MPTIVQDYTVPTRGIGLPDYAQAKPVGSVPVGVVYTSTDVAELAARLGSPVTFDRRGNVIWYDDFSNGVLGWQVTNGLWAQPHWIHDEAAKKGFCLSYAGDMNEIRRVLPYPVLSRMGFEFTFVMTTDIAQVVLTINLYDGINRHQAIFHYNVVTSHFYVSGVIVDPGMVLVTVPPLVPATVLRHTVKLVVDFPNNRYERLIANNLEYDLTNRSYLLTANANPPYVDCMIRFGTTAPWVFSNLRLDDFIATYSEPANVTT